MVSAYFFKQIISSRPYIRLETESLKTIKIANAIALTLVEKQGNPIKSGWSRDDFLVEILNQMFAQLKGSTQLEEDKSSLTEYDK